MSKGTKPSSVCLFAPISAIQVVLGSDSLQCENFVHTSFLNPDLRGVKDVKLPPNSNKKSVCRSATRGNSRYSRHGCHRSSQEVPAKFQSFLIKFERMGNLSYHNYKRLCYHAMIILSVPTRQIVCIQCVLCVVVSFSVHACKAWENIIFNNHRPTVTDCLF